MMEIRQLTKRFGTNLVLDHLDLALPDGTTTVLMGPSGSGKTTLANILLGLLHPDAGTVAGLDGARLAAVFQEDRLCEGLTAPANVRLVLHDGGARHPHDAVRAELAAVGLAGDDLHKPVSQLSGGQRRRVAIVRAMMAGADFTVLDEPFKGLDEATRDRVLGYVRDRLAGRTALVITHDPAEATRFDGPRVSLDR
ncbi:MAG: ATP-binding cassette domain-containing protein [Actinomycetota bacterium]